MLRSLILVLALALGTVASAQDAPTVDTPLPGSPAAEALTSGDGEAGIFPPPGTGEVRATNAGPAAEVLIQERGIGWLQFREGPLVRYGVGLLVAVAALLAIFYVLKGRVDLHGQPSGRTVKRFNILERSAHWLLAGSFLLLGVTGLLLLIGRPVLIPLFGHEAYAAFAVGSKWIHNNVSWAFMLSLVVVFVLWVAQNLPRRGDLEWLMKGGGFFGGDHVPARKFNAGQKAIFWSVIIFGASISASGLSLLFPFDVPLFAKSFGIIDATGIPGLFGLDLPTALAPQEEMQYAQAWHSIVSFVLMAIIVAHIYIGSIGMQGAYSAMGSGRVDEQWAREHHSIWLDEVRRDHPDHIEAGDRPRGTRGTAATPAE